MENDNILEVPYTNVYERNLKSNALITVNVGGAGSSKSLSICQILIKEYLFNPDVRNGQILILRKTRQSLKKSTYKMFFGLLEQYKLYWNEWHNKSEMEYTVPQYRNTASFLGVDDREKLKSTEWDVIFVEELSDFTPEDLMFLTTRLQRGTITVGSTREIKHKIKIYGALNPVDCWVKDLEGRKKTEFIYSTYKDNPFMNVQARQTLEDLKDQDETYYKIYTLGQWAKPKHIIYEPYTTIPYEQYPERYDEIIYALDFGYNVETALLKIGVKDGQFYLDEEIYQTHLTNSQRIELLKKTIPRENMTAMIYGDPEAADSIKEISNAGFNIVPATKGPGSVKTGIDLCKRLRFFTHAGNVNLNTERERYKWKQDKNGNMLDEPVKFKDHLMDCKRMGIFSHFKRMGDPTDIKQALTDIEEGQDAITSDQYW